MNREQLLLELKSRGDLELYLKLRDKSDDVIKWHLNITKVNKKRIKNKPLL
jgi:hypothetical protein